MLLASSFVKYLQDQEVELVDRLAESFKRKDTRVQMSIDSTVYWMKNQIGFESLPYAHFLNKWEVPNGQYKNWSVVLQTLALVPKNERANSTGLIVGAKMQSSGGQWIHFLFSAMKEMGFTGSVSLYDVGLTDETYQASGLIMHSYSGQYYGQDKFTWCVDDIWFASRPGEVQNRATYESYKNHKGERKWFSPSEGRTFLSHAKEVIPQWPWMQGQCPCDRCSFERQFAESIQRTLRFFDGRCSPGAWEHFSDIMVTLRTGNAYVPHNSASLASALVIANMAGLASGEKCVQPYQGALVLVDNELQGDLPLTQDIEKGTKGPVVEPARGWRAPASRVSLPTVGDLPAKYTYMPESEYAEYEATSLVHEDHRGYVRKHLPLDQRKNVLGLRHKDPFGRMYVGEECGAGQVWCWQEKKLVMQPHKCPLGTGSRNKKWRGYCTSFPHPDDALDLCTKCDRSIKTYFHKCVGLSLFSGVTKKEAAQYVEDLRWDKPTCWRSLPSWTVEEERVSNKRKTKEGIDLMGRDIT